MRQRNKKGKLLIWVLSIGILTVYIVMLCKGVAAIAEEIERCIHILTKVLFISGLVGEISSLMVINRFNILLTGKTPNIIDDLREESSQDVAVTYNGMIGGTSVVAIISIFFILNAYYKNRLFLYIGIVLSITYTVLIVLYYLSIYVKSKNNQPQFDLAKWSEPVFLPMIIFLIQLLVTRKKLLDLYIIIFIIP